MKKVLGDIVGGFPGENTPPDAPASYRPVPRASRPRTAERASAARGDIIIRYERVYEAANHSHVHISNGRSPRYSV